MWKKDTGKIKADKNQWRHLVLKGTVQKEAKRLISFAYQNKDKERDCYSYVNLAAEQNGKELNKLKDGGCWNKCM